MPLGCGLEEQHADGEFGGEVEDVGGRVGEQAGQLGLRRGHHLERQLLGRADVLVGLAVDLVDGGAQAFVPDEHIAERRVQVIRRQGTAQPRREGHVVDRVGAGRAG